MGMIKTHPDMVGPRYREILNRFQKAGSAPNGKLSVEDQTFIEDVTSRLIMYGDRCLVSVKQLNKLTRIEAKL